MTPLDRDAAAMEAAPGDEALRRAFWARLMASRLFLLLDEDAGDVVRPMVLEVEAVPLALVFDTEARLAEFLSAPAPVLEAEGREIVGMLAGKGLALGLNLGVAEAAALLPAEGVDWAAAALGAGAEGQEGAGLRLTPLALPEAVLGTLAARLAVLLPGGEALLAGAGEGATLLALPGVAEGAQEGIAAAMAEVWALSGGPGVLDLAFPEKDSALAARVRAAGLAISLPARRDPPAAPARDPARAPRLR